MSITTAYVFTQIPAAAVAYWAFKLHENKFEATSKAHILKGLVKAQERIEDVLKAGMQSSGRDHFESILQGTKNIAGIDKFDFTKLQAKAITERSLYQLSRVTEEFKGPEKYYDFTYHDPTGGIFGAGVCRLGKVGGWTILITLLITFILILLGESGYNRYNKKGRTIEASNHLKNYVLSVIIINSIIFGIILILSTIMNRPLFLRTLPFYSLQLGILFNLGYVYSKNN